MRNTCAEVLLQTLRTGGHKCSALVDQVALEVGQPETWARRAILAGGLYACEEFLGKRSKDLCLVNFQGELGDVYLGTTVKTKILEAWEALIYV